MVCYVHPSHFVSTSPLCETNNCKQLSLPNTLFLSSRVPITAPVWTLFRSEKHLKAWCVSVWWICHTSCVSITDDGGITDFLKDLFTIAPSIRLFVVVITLPASGPRVIITGPHLAHHFFLTAQAHINTEVWGSAFLNITVNQTIIVCCSISVIVYLKIKVIFVFYLINGSIHIWLDCEVYHSSYLVLFF